MKTSILTLLLFLVNTIQAQMTSFDLGGRNAGIAGASITLGDSYSLFNNVGGIARISKHSIFVSYQNRYGIEQFQVVGAGAIYSHEIGNAGIGFFKFGDDIYSEQRIHLALGHKVQMVSLGLGLDLLQYSISGIGTKQALVIQFGGVVELSKKIWIGAHIYNVNQAKLRTEFNERIPVLMKTGLSYRPSTELMINMEVEKDLLFEETFKAGMEYMIIDHVFMRTGIRTQPFIGAFGIGFHPKNLQFDYAFSNDFILGNTHEVSLAISLEK